MYYFNNYTNYSILLKKLKYFCHGFVKLYLFMLCDSYVYIKLRK